MRFPFFTLLSISDIFTGREKGGSFGELNRILQNVSNKDKIGLCYDSCHNTQLAIST